MNYQTLIIVTSDITSFFHEPINVSTYKILSYITFFIMVFMCKIIFDLFNYSFSNEKNLIQLKSVWK